MRVVKCLVIGLLWMSTNAMTYGSSGRKVILIGVDGLSIWGLEHAEAPVLRHLMQSGAYTKTARAMLPTVSGPNWASMLTGAAPFQHGVLGNDFKPGEYLLPPQVADESGAFPTIFSLAMDQKPQLKTAVVHHWGGIKNLFNRRHVAAAYDTATERSTVDRACELIRTESPDFLFVHLDHVDGAGHSQGHRSKEYLEAVHLADRLIGEIIEATQVAGFWSETNFLISSDHGGIGKGHGGATLDEVLIPIIMAGPNIRALGELPSNHSILDITPTAAAILELQIPQEVTGRAISGALALR